LFVAEKYREIYKDLPRNVASFFGMIANLDENLGRLEALLTEAGLRDNTLIVFMTDNGGTAGVDFFNAGMRGRKIGLWEGGHRVPCFLRWPKAGLGGGREIKGLTAIQDLLPTFIDLCGLKAPVAAKFDGVNIRPLLRAQGPIPDRKLVVQFSRMGVGRPQFGDACVLWKKWRLVTNDRLYDVAADPAQQNDVIAKHPDVAASMRDHYARWWKEVEPRLDSFLPVHIGSDKENPVLLSPTEWADSFLDQAVQIRRGEPRNGFWHVMVEEGGEYRFKLRRWPKEVAVPMRAGIPAHKGEDGVYPAGVALPVAKVRMVAGTRELAQDVGAEEEEAVFTLPLAEGWMKLQTWLCDRDGRELSGAYFVYAERIPPVRSRR